MKFSPKTALLLITAIFLVGCQAAGGVAEINPNEIILTVSDANSEVSLTYADFQALGMLSGYGGIKTTTERISGPDLYSGVDLMDVIELVDQSGEAVSVQVEASDGYAITFSSEQVQNGNYLTYDPKTGEEIIVTGLRTILASEQNGQPLDAEKSGRLRLRIISQDANQVTDGHWSVKYINQVKIKPFIQEWVLNLEGALQESMDRATFESGTAEKCHQATFVDGAGNEWMGIPLWLLLGRVDDENSHGDNAFNDELATSGYEVEVVSKTGKSIKLPSQDVIRNNDLLVVFSLNGNPLTDVDFPLRLVGEDVNTENEITQIKSIILHLP